MARVCTIVLVVILALLELRLHQVFDPFRRSLSVPGRCCVIDTYGVADNLASFCEVEQACLLNFIFWDAGCGSACHRGWCPVLGGVAGEWPFDSGRSGEHGIAFGGVGVLGAGASNNEIT